MKVRSRIIAFFLIVILLGGTFGFTAGPIMKRIKLGLDLQGGFEVLYDVKPAEKGQKIDSEVLKSTASALDRRINVLGVSEPNISIEGKDRVRVQLAGVTDQAKARKILSTEANLTFRDYEDNVMLDGKDLKEGGSKVVFDPQTNAPIIQLKLRDADKFGKVTGAIKAKYPNNQLVIWLDFEEGKDSYVAEKQKADPKYVSAPNCDVVINSDTATITGSFTTEEAQELSDILNAGALPVKLKEIYSTSVGAKFGKDALNETILAGVVALLAVFAFMIWFYRFPGFVASLTLTAYCYFMILIFDWMNGVLTLPGIAALILGVGIAVDANIIGDERVKDELKKGRSVKAAFKEGNKHSLATIIDAHVTTFLVGVVLFAYGTSSVKGFATMLVISIVVGFVTAVFGTRGLMSLWVNSGFFDNRLGWLDVKKEEILNLKDVEDDLNIPTRYDRFNFIKPIKYFFATSIIMTAIGLVALPTIGLNAGIDFSSGSRIEITSNQKLTVPEVKKEVESFDIEVEDAILAGTGSKAAIVRTKGVLSKTKIEEVKKSIESKHGTEPNISTVSPTIGKELAKNAMIAVVIASIGIIIYVTLRFEWRMAIAAIISLLHDAFFIVTFFSLFRFEVDLNFIAAVLTIIGYSINDTIVTFDRVRENMKKMKKLKTVEDLEFVANVSIRQTLGRSIKTVLTVIITVVAMLLFGSSSIFNFNLALLVGLVIGMYSSILIAVPLWVMMKKNEIQKNGPINTLKPKRKSIEGTV
ncbi:MAG: secDF [Bacillales bacterium]|jgi:SecD/SecF fusion protein|nr:secDF [Bacillales bacterium]